MTITFLMSTITANHDSAITDQYNVVHLILLFIVYYSQGMNLKRSYRHLDSLVVECWHRVREVPGSIPSQGPLHTNDIIKYGTSSYLV